MSDYKPCTNDYEPGPHNLTYSLSCRRRPAKNIANAFHRNEPNINVTAVYIDWVTDMNDDIINDILHEVRPSSATLQTLGLLRLQLTRVPEDVRHFTALKNCYLSVNPLKVLGEGSLTFSSQLETLTIANSQVESIEEGAFVGDFSRTVIDLSYNSLTTFDENVFKPILQEKLRNGTSSYLRVYYNPITCDCNLAWLLRDNRQLLAYVIGSCFLQKRVIMFPDVDADTLSLCP